MLDTLQAAARLYLRALVSVCVYVYFPFLTQNGGGGVVWVLSLSSMQSTNIPLSILSIVLWVRLSICPLGIRPVLNIKMHDQCSTPIPQIVTHPKVCQVLGCGDTEVVHNISGELLVLASSPLFIPSFLFSVMN